MASNNSIDKEPLDISINSERLLLRRIQSEDTQSIVNLAGDFEIADMMNGAIPHPYTINDAQVWVNKHLHDSIQSTAISWAIIEKNKKVFVGSVQLRKIEKDASRISYWIGKNYWGHGYASEAIKAVCEFAQKKLNLKYIRAEHFARNPRSGSVLIKNKFSLVGKYIKKEGLMNREELRLCYERNL